MRLLRTPHRQPHRAPRFSAVSCCLLLAGLGAAQSGAAGPGTTSRLDANSLFAPNHLVRVELTLPNEDWDALRSERRVWSESLAETARKRPFRYFPARARIDGIDLGAVRLRKKGFIGSLDRVRPSLKIRWGKAARARIRGVDRLTLNNNKQDQSLVSQFLGYRTFRRAGCPAPRCNFAQVFVNGVNLGIYSNVEAVKPPLLERLFGDGSGDLFEGTVADFLPGAVERFEAKTKSPDRRPLQRLANALAKEPPDLEAVARDLDLAAFLRFWAVESLIGFWDGYGNNQNNFFVYAAPRRAGVPKLQLMPWGLDSAFAVPMLIPPYGVRTKAVHSQAALPNRLYRLPSIQKRYRETMEAVLARAWDEADLNRALDRVVELVNGKRHPHQEHFDREIRRQRRFIKTRRRVLLRSLKRGPVKIQGTPRVPPRVRRVGSATATFRTSFFDRKAVRPLKEGTATLRLQWDGKPKTTFAALGVRAELGLTPSLDGTQRPPTLVFTGKRAGDGQTCVLVVSISPREFRSDRIGGDLAGVYYEGWGALNPLSYRFVSGEIRLKAAGTNAGDKVEGTLEVEILEMRGGDLPARRR